MFIFSDLKNNICLNIESELGKAITELQHFVCDGLPVLLLLFIHHFCNRTSREEKKALRCSVISLLLPRLVSDRKLDLDDNVVRVVLTLILLSPLNHQ